MVDIKQLASVGLAQACPNKYRRQIIFGYYISTRTHKFHVMDGLVQVYQLKNASIPDPRVLLS